MGKVLIVSDNHGRIDTLKKIIDMEKPVDLVIHCGDSEMTDIIPTLTKHSDARVCAVSGDCDIFSDLPSRADFDYMGHHILVVHGHYDNVSYGTHELYRKAKMTGSDIVFFGHTHVPFLRKDDGVTALIKSSQLQLQPPGCCFFQLQFRMCHQLILLHRLP